jgi:voltage-dependent calcium channel L type alpha-1D
MGASAASGGGGCCLACFRRRCQRITKTKLFSNGMLVAILFNTVVIGIEDHSSFNPLTGHGVATGSVRNEFCEYVEPIMLGIFSVEAVVRMTAAGCAGYFRDNWNRLDFATVFFSVLESVLGNAESSLSFLRLLRVLRPLRVTHQFPGVKLLVQTLLESLGGLKDSMLLLILMVSIWSLVALQLWGRTGVSHNFCRSTPFPVREAAGGWEQCLPGLPSDSDAWTQSTSAWQTPQDCHWPLARYADGGTRACHLGEDAACLAGAMASVFGARFNSSGNGGGAGGAQHGGPITGAAQYACGSNFDVFGNPRFSGALVMGGDLFTPERDFGLTVFDSYGQGVMTVLQCITMEGWSAVMYRVQVWPMGVRCSG